jgi:hypothetical protein
MRKEHESGVGNELTDWNLLDTNDYVALAEVFADHSALFLVLVVRKNPLFRWLNNDLNVLVVFE